MDIPWMEHPRHVFMLVASAYAQSEAYVLVGPEVIPGVFSDLIGQHTAWLICIFTYALWIACIEKQASRLVGAFAPMQSLEGSQQYNMHICIARLHTLAQYASGRVSYLVAGPSGLVVWAGHCQNHNVFRHAEGNNTA